MSHLPPLYAIFSPEFIQDMYSFHAYTKKYFKKKLEKMTGREVTIKVDGDNIRLPEKYQEVDLSIDINGKISISKLK